MAETFSPIELARAAGLFVARVTAPATTSLHPGLLLIGPEATDGHIATAAVRVGLAKRGRADEATVQTVVERLGYEYVPN